MTSGAAFSLVEREDSPDGVVATFQVPAESSLFAGHFPGQPILPGIGLLGMVEAALSSGDGPERLSLTGLRRVKFRRLVSAGGIFVVHLAYSPDPGRAKFRVSLEGEVAADGICSSGAPAVTAREATSLAEPLDLNLNDLIPHRRPMRIVDDLLEVSPGQATSRGTVSEAWPLMDDAGASRVSLVELIAQTASTIIGWERRDEERIGGRGYLVGIREASLGAGRLSVGDSLTATVVTARKRENYVIFEGTVQMKGVTLGSAIVQAYRP
jgi:predicted hotdog family 3-hydroxylacyl-ACP dehydratase